MDVNKLDGATRSASRSGHLSSPVYSGGGVMQVGFDAVSLLAGPIHNWHSALVDLLPEAGGLHPTVACAASYLFWK